MSLDEVDEVFSCLIISEPQGVFIEEQPLQMSELAVEQSIDKPLVLLCKLLCFLDAQCIEVEDCHVVASLRLDDGSCEPNELQLDWDRYACLHSSDPQLFEVGAV